MECMKWFPRDRTTVMSRSQIYGSALEKGTDKRNVFREQAAMGPTIWHKGDLG